MIRNQIDFIFLANKKNYSSVSPVLVDFSSDPILYLAGSFHSRAE